MLDTIFLRYTCSSINCVNFEVVLSLSIIFLVYFNLAVTFFHGNGNEFLGQMALLLINKQLCNKVVLMKVSIHVHYQVK